MSFPKGRLGEALVRYADKFTTADRCSYCFFYRGAAFHGVLAGAVTALVSGNLVLGSVLGAISVFLALWLWTTND